MWILISGYGSGCGIPHLDMLLDVDSHIWIWNTVSAYDIPSLDMVPDVEFHIGIWVTISGYGIPYPDMKFHIWIWFWVWNSISGYGNHKKTFTSIVKLENQTTAFPEPPESLCICDPICFPPEVTGMDSYPIDRIHTFRHIWITLEMTPRRLRNASLICDWI